MVIVDTNVIIDHLRVGFGGSALSRLEKKFPGEKLSISVITVQELYEGKSVSDERNEEKMVAVLVGFEVLSYDYEVAKKAGELNRNLVQPIGTADAAIAATCLVNDCKLATLNRGDFLQIQGLGLVEW